jgi:hypothetical protein
MTKFLLNLLVQISKAFIYSKIQFLFEKEFSSTFGPISPVASWPIRPFWPRVARQAESAHQAMPPFPFLPPSPCRQRHRRAMDAAPPSVPWSCNGHPPFTLVTIAMKAPIAVTARHSRPPPPLSRPYKRVPALRWSTSPLHHASIPPQSCPHRGRLEPKHHR